jgi:RNA polymerase sigma-70 factor, ECF subfamily
MQTEASAGASMPVVPRPARCERPSATAPGGFRASAASGRVAPAERFGCLRRLKAVNAVCEAPRILSDDDVARVRSVLYLNGLRGDEIEDALQELHARILERAPTALGSLSAWACAVATNLALDVHRRSRRRGHAETRLRALPAVESENADLALREAVRAGLAQIEPTVRAIVVLRFYADLTIPEIAAAIGAPEGTVKSRLHRGVAELRRFLPKEGIGHD